MKIICNKAKLNEAINNVSKAVADKSTIPALEGIKLKLDNNKLELTGYDLEIGIKTIMDVSSSDTGEFIINARLFNDIIRKMPTEEIEISVDSNMSVKILGGVTEYSISSTSAEDYPDIPKIDENESFSINQAKLRNMISQTIFAVSQSDSKPILKGELFEVENENLNIVAIDGYRLAVRKEVINCDKIYKFVVPSKALLEVSRLLKDDEDLTCEIKISKKHIIFDVSGYMLVTRLLEGEFHSYRGSIPANSVTEVELKTRDLINSLERASLLINERVKSPVKCVFENGAIKISCSTSIGKINDEIPADMTGPTIEIGFNCKYLLDPLKAIDDDRIKLQMNGGNLPLKIVPVNDDNFTFLVLPVRLKNE